MKSTITIEQLSEKLNGNLWVKGELKRIYLNVGYTTNKMKTTAYIYEQNGDFKISVNVYCPSQSSNWIEQQEDECYEIVKDMLNDALKEEEVKEIKEVSNDYQVGERYLNEKLGEGEIISVEDSKIVIRFESGEKTLIKKFAQLTKINLK